MVKEKQVVILMSTYNGERYLKEQIESIRNQNYPDWQLYIRDDGSQDRTQDIIRNYTKQDARIHFFNESHVHNVGVVNSFMDLFEHTSADYYMFSDQDDYWLPNKVGATLQLMQQSEEQGAPVCVHTDLKIVDADLNGDELMNGDDVWHQFTHLMFGNCITGCTMMVNSALKDYVEFDRLDINRIYMHDWWLALIAAAFGKVEYLNQPTILYRQHGDNVVGSKQKNTIPYLIHRLFNQKMDEDNMMHVFMVSNEFKKMYVDRLTGKDKRYIEVYGDVINHSSVLSNIATFIKYPPLRNHLKGKIFFAYLMVQDAQKIKNLAN
ncbi:glycosyltransferase family 2 protein [Limosilactobacillus caecicola]|uniref:glycosyltransferase family 2 protein n=1 Tax=Limosilactobacillus caecicola TaxID=2941332 RepID=UPI00203F058C|nr:glycosyltransferase family 2 protein [Limosilactobacillus caecicola]